MFSENINRDLLSRYDLRGPRYTSYPTANRFNEKFTDQDYMEIARQTNENLIPSSLSLYFHLPFCSTVCFYCACNKIITKNRNHSTGYLDTLKQEIVLQSQLYDADRSVKQLHWGGGTPTFFTQEQSQELMDCIRKHFTFLNDDSGEYSIEIDPREVTTDYIRCLRELGFNRISIGVQDFDPDVQRAVNRIQGFEQTEQVVQYARLTGFRSVNIDLIYGLPRQNSETFARTLEKIMQLHPDRIALYNYAHLPGLFKIQKQINEDELPVAEEKLDILKNSIEYLEKQGYDYIGMDHFSRPEDELAVAQQNGKLHRNFQGYSTHADCDLIGMGISAISKTGNSYSQHVKTLEEYEQRINEGKIPISRGKLLDEDDLIRRDVIMNLICHFFLDYQVIEDRYSIDFREYFYQELADLSALENDGLLELDSDAVRVSDTGRLLIRNICMVFDKYLRQDSGENYFSKVV